MDFEELEKLSIKELEELQYKVSYILIKKIYNIKVIPTGKLGDF